MARISLGATFFRTMTAVSSISSRFIVDSSPYRCGWSSNTTAPDAHQCGRRADGFSTAPLGRRLRQARAMPPCTSAIFPAGSLNRSVLGGNVLSPVVCRHGQASFMPSIPALTDVEPTEHPRKNPSIRYLPMDRFRSSAHRGRSDTQSFKRQIDAKRPARRQQSDDRIGSTTNRALQRIASRTPAWY